MAFPTTSVLDDFNRANESPVNTNWAAIPDIADGEMNLNTNAVRAAEASTSMSHWSAASFGPDMEVFITVVVWEDANGSNHFLHVRLDPSGTTGIDGYQMATTKRSGQDDQIEIVRLDADTETILGSVFDVGGELDDGIDIGLEVIGTTIAVYRDTGGGWSQDFSREDSTYDGTSPHVRIAMGMEDESGSMDDFGGGTVAVTTVSFPSFQPRHYSPLLRM